MLILICAYVYLMAMKNKLSDWQHEGIKPNIWYLGCWKIQGYDVACELHG
jgi:hypothetical protein